MEGQIVKEYVVPCDPASDRRSTVPGLQSEKCATEGDGGVESQALPAAAATGAAPAAKETAARSNGPGPVQKKRRPGQAKRRMQRLRQLEASSGAVLGAEGIGRGGNEASRPSSTLPNKTGGKNHRKKQSAYLKEEAVRADAINQCLEGTAKVTGLTELAPAVMACMARINPSKIGVVIDGAPDPNYSVVMSHHSALPVRDSVPGGCADGSAVVTDRKPIKTANAEINKDLEKRKIKENKPTIPTEVAKGNGEVQLPSRPLQTPCPLDKGVGGVQKGCDGASTAPIRADVVSEANGASCQGVDSTRPTKRQRSSDQVSPGLAGADKKLCMAHGSFTDLTRLGETEGRAIGREGPQVVSYATAVKRYRVVVQDRSGIMMDKTKATLLRKSIDKAQYELFKANRAVPKDQRRLPVFGQRLARLLHGCLKITPCDDFSLAWLVSTLENMPPMWEGSRGFRVIPESELPRYNTGIIYVPDFNEERDDLERWPFILREFLAELNKCLNIECWPIFKHIVRQNGQTFNHILVMGIPAVDVEKLKQVNNRLHYTTGSVYVKVKESKIGGSARPRAEAGRVASAVESGEGTSSVAATSAEAVPPEDKEWTREEVDRLLEVDGEGEDDITGDIMGLTIFSPLSLMDTERECVASDHSLDN